jgi:hypothetical protein
MAGKYDISSAIVVPPIRRPNNSSGRGMFADVPAEVPGWNWGAFLLGWIWGVKNRTWVALWTFIPIVGIPVHVILGVKGSEWAWRNRQWENVEQFQRTQRRWSWYGLILMLVILALLIVQAFVAGSS